MSAVDVVGLITRKSFICLEKFTGSMPRLAARTCQNWDDRSLEDIHGISNKKPTTHDQGRQKIYSKRSTLFSDVWHLRPQKCPFKFQSVFPACTSLRLPCKTSTYSFTLRGVGMDSMMVKSWLLFFWSPSETTQKKQVLLYDTKPNHAFLREKTSKLAHILALIKIPPISPVI